MVQINVGKPKHLHTEGVDANVGDWLASGKAISTACAVTIASWYQTPRGTGATFAEFSTRGTANDAALREAIEDALNEVSYEPDQVNALNALRAWTLAYTKAWS